MPSAADSSSLQQPSEDPPGHRNGNGSQSLLPYLAQSLATKPSFHASERPHPDTAGQPDVPSRTD